MVILIIVAGRFCLGARLLTPVAPSAPMMSGPKNSKIGMGVVRLADFSAMSFTCNFYYFIFVMKHNKQTEKYKYKSMTISVS